MTTTVGQAFIDRAQGVDISNSIVKVVRFPPTPNELENPLRFASLAPESSARPRKRVYEEFIEPVQTNEAGEDQGNGYRPEQLVSSHRGMNKRQRKYGMDVNGIGDPRRPIQSGETFRGLAVQDLSQISALQQSSCVQVTDSQRSPGRKSMLSISRQAGS
jgi:hypothetical protein